KLAACYNLPIEEDSTAKALAFLGFQGQGETAFGEYIERKVASVGKVTEEGRAALERRSPLEHELIASLAPHYDTVSQGRPLERLEWPPYALMRPDFPDRL